MAAFQASTGMATSSSSAPNTANTPKRGTARIDTVVASHPHAVHALQLAHQALLLSSGVESSQPHGEVVLEGRLQRIERTSESRKLGELGIPGWLSRQRGQACQP